jgi:hypothetical protein
VRASAPTACLLLLCGCWSSPPVGGQHTALQSLQRPLTPDLTTATFAARTGRLAATLEHLASEPGRATRAAAMPGRLLGDELARGDDLVDAATTIGGELGRGRDLGASAASVLDHLAGPAGDRGHHTTAAARLLGLDRPPLGEIDDRRHRTDPDDDGPEAGFWQRILRRLRL